MTDWETERNLRMKIGNLVDTMRKLTVDTMTAEDEQTYHEMDKELTQLERQLTALERQKRYSASVREPHRGDPEYGHHGVDVLARLNADPRQTRVWEPGTFKAQRFEIRDDVLYQEMRDLNQYFQTGMVALPENVKARFAERALQMDSSVKGGYLVAPEQFSEAIIEALMDEVFLRPYATIVTCPTAQSLGVPVLDHDIGDPTWTSELSTGAEDKTMDFEKRQLYPHPLARRILVSNTLIRRNNLVSDLVKRRLTYKFGVVEESNFLGGDGAIGDGQNKPLGVFTVSDQGITTARDISDGNTTTAIKADNLINCAYALKAQYRRKARWIFHRDALKMIRKLKDGEGSYLWQLGIAQGRPNTICDLPYDESEYAPNTFSSGKYVGILGDFSFYWIADCLDMQLQVLTELYAETNQTGFIGRKETDGMPVLEEAFVRVKLA